MSESKENSVKLNHISITKLNKKVASLQLLHHELNFCLFKQKVISIRLLDIRTPIQLLLKRINKILERTLLNVWNFQNRLSCNNNLINLSKSALLIQRRKSTLCNA